jgi:hypothetical protein
MASERSLVVLYKKKPILAKVTYQSDYQVIQECTQQGLELEHLSIHTLDLDKKPEPTQTIFGLPKMQGAFVAAAYMVRDAVVRYRETCLQKDADELDRLIRLFNLPPDIIVEKIIEEYSPNK